MVVIVEESGYILSESTHQIDVIGPASFKTSNLSIEPSSVQIGETVKISVEVINEGGSKSDVSSDDEENTPNKAEQ